MRSKSFWHYEQSTAVPLPCSMQNSKTTWIYLWVTEILRNLNLRWGWDSLYCVSCHRISSPFVLACWLCHSHLQERKYEMWTYIQRYGIRGKYTLVVGTPVHISCQVICQNHARHLHPSRVTSTVYKRNKLTAVAYWWVQLAWSTRYDNVIA